MLRLRLMLRLKIKKNVIFFLDAMIGDRTPTPSTPMPPSSSSGSFDRNRTGV